MMCSLLLLQVPAKLLLSACHLLVSMATTVRPVFMVSLSAVQNIFNLITENHNHRLPQEVCVCLWRFFFYFNFYFFKTTFKYSIHSLSRVTCLKLPVRSFPPDKGFVCALVYFGGMFVCIFQAYVLVCRALSNMLLLPWPSLPEAEQQWPSRSTNHARLISTITHQYRLLPRPPDHHPNSEHNLCHVTLPFLDCFTVQKKKKIHWSLAQYGYHIFGFLVMHCADLM